MKCMRCHTPLKVWFNVILCDDCLEYEIKCTDLEKAHRRLGENVADAPSVEDLEAMWKL
jgi:hypothetical protein